MPFSTFESQPMIESFVETEGTLNVAVNYWFSSDEDEAVGEGTGRVRPATLHRILRSKLRARCADGVSRRNVGRGADAGQSENG